MTQDALACGCLFRFPSAKTALTMLPVGVTAVHASIVEASGGSPKGITGHTCPANPNLHNPAMVQFGIRLACPP